MAEGRRNGVSKRIVPVIIRFALPGEGAGWTKLKGDQGWRGADGSIWKKDKKHKDHWDVSDPKGNKVREVDFRGVQIWPAGPKNKNKRPK